MSALNYTLHRHRDVSGVSGEGSVATICEFGSGLVAMHWDSETPSVTVYTDIRHVLKLHGHQGASELEPVEPERLLAAYQLVMPNILEVYGTRRPVTVGPHPEHPDRLRVTFDTERAWAFWVALFDGSTFAATHEEVKGEIQTTWISPDGNLWLQYFTPGTFMDLLEGETYDEYPDHDAHDPRD